MTVNCEKSDDDSSKESKNRRTLSESDVRHAESVSLKSENFKNPLDFKGKLEEFSQQKRSHSLPHRYKIPHLAIRSNVTPTRQKCVSPQEFRRGIQAMQSWFHNLNDTQRTLALQSITVRQISFFQEFYVRF